MCVSFVYISELYLKLITDKLVLLRDLPILGDPGADSGGEGKSKQAGKYGTREK